MKKPDLFRRAYKFAERRWKPRTFLWNGQEISVTWEFSRYIREFIADAWRQGYKAGRASK